MIISFGYLTQFDFVLFSYFYGNCTELMMHPCLPNMLDLKFKETLWKVSSLRFQIYFEIKFRGEKEKSIAPCLFFSFMWIINLKSVTTKYLRIEMITSLSTAYVSINVKLI